jgi:hypothetical protein
MKKFIVVLALACLVGGAAYAQIPVSMDKGDFSVAAGINFGWDYGFGGSLEYMFARVDIADAVPITFGVAARAGVGFVYGTNYTVVGLATAHLSLGFISDLPSWLKPFDFYYGLGLGAGFGTNDFGFGLGNGGGVAYYLNPNLAIYSSVIYVRYFDRTAGGSGFGSIGLIFKL